MANIHDSFDEWLKEQHAKLAEQLKELEQAEARVEQLTKRGSSSIVEPAFTIRVLGWLASRSAVPLQTPLNHSLISRALSTATYHTASPARHTQHTISRRSIPSVQVRWPWDAVSSPKRRWARLRL